MFLLFVLLPLALASTDPQGAWLLASKAPVSNFPVEGMDFVVSYGIYNVGDRPASQVTLDDRHSFPPQYFEKVSGDLQVSISRLNPGDHFTHLVVVRPLHPGLFNSSAGKIDYRTDVDTKEMRSGLTTFAPEMYVYRRADYDTRFGSKMQYFVLFFIIMTPLTLGSFFQFIRLSSRYTSEETSNTKKAPKTD